MKKNLSRIVLLILILGFSVSTVFAQEPAPANDPANPEPKTSLASVDVDVVFVTDYVFRGVSLHDNYFVQEGKSYEGYKFAPAFQPSVTVSSPVDGLSFNLWGSFAMTHRDDMDSDKRFQFGPGDIDLLTTPNPLGLTDPATGNPLAVPAIVSTSGLDPNAFALFNSILQHAPQQILANGIAAWYGGYNYQGGTPGLYNEANGLSRVDELDFTLDYSTETKIGNFSFGIVNYALVNQKSMGGSSFYHEVYFAYALPFFSDLSVKVFSDVQTNNLYSNLSYGSSFEFTEDLSLDYAAGVGYGVRNRLQGIQDVTGSLGFTFKGFSISGNVSHRPNMAFIEASDPNTKMPLWLNGGSTAADGMVEDPSRVNGIMNSLINQAITNELTQGGANTLAYGEYQYIPRTKLPTNIYWISMGYSTSF
ncbi:MAG: hypothetical protein OEZ34_11495 [Spirochaetia bacterium]|nr:hypothetical protein [Spirochaetia bacterium]